ncbi:3475_t:CDS:1, partial [Funneliformis geosporum]
KAAENGLKVAMYNAGNLHFIGFGGDKRDYQQAKYYMKLAAYHEYSPAIKFCKEHNFD